MTEPWTTDPVIGLLLRAAMGDPASVEEVAIEQERDGKIKGVTVHTWIFDDPMMEGNYGATDDPEDAAAFDVECAVSDREAQQAT